MTSQEIQNLINDTADQLVYAAQGDDVPDHAIEAHATDRRIADMVAGAYTLCSPRIQSEANALVTSAFCQDVRDAIAKQLCP